MGKLNSKHRRAIENLSLHPEILGLDNIMGSAIEVNLFDNKGNLQAQPDVIFLDSQLNIYVIEYKSNGNTRLKRRAEQQLYEAVSWFSKLGITAKTMIVDGEQYPQLKKTYSKSNKYHRKTIKMDFGKR